MNFKTLVAIIACILFILIFMLIVFFTLMRKHRRRVKKEDFPDCPDLVFYRYKLWCSSFSLWTSIQFAFIILPVLSSLVTIYFSVGYIAEKSLENIELLSVMAFLSATLPLLNDKIMPKEHADGFYQGAITIEQGMLRFASKLITLDELLMIFKQAESYTNRFSHFKVGKPEN